VSAPRHPTIALVPFRVGGKTRLGVRPGPSSGLTRAERQRLATAMLTDVAGALCDAVDQVVIAAADQRAVTVAEELGITWVLDPPGDRGLNVALDAAAARLSPRTRLLVVAADLPLLGSEDVRRVLGDDGQVTIAPSSRGGTGGLVRHPPDAVRAAFGPGSAERHRELAERAGLVVSVQHLDGFHHDVDTVDDLRRLPHARVGPATREALRRVAHVPAR
jgi:2-phospho-L-lactate/phosphoenolpyruvate guanylyltransferase